MTISFLFLQIKTLSSTNNSPGRKFWAAGKKFFLSENFCLQCNILSSPKTHILGEIQLDKSEI